MPRLRFRADLEAIAPYRPGKPLSEVAERVAASDLAKLGSNEHPDPPFPEVVAAMADAVTDVNRYPDNEKPTLRASLAEHLGVTQDHVWTGGASNELTLITALTMGGAGTTAVYGWPSFSLYRIGTLAAHATPIEVPLDDRHRFDLASMEAAIDERTTVVYVCNPNNPTGTHLPGDDLVRFVDAVPEEVLVVVDEAYHEFVTAPDHRSLASQAVERPNLMVTRTFSKVYGLAGLRVGYAVTQPSTIAELRRIQLPFSVSTVAQAAACEALRHQDRVTERVEANRIGRERLTTELTERGVTVAPSQANFVYAEFGPDADAVAAGLLDRGVIVRPVVPGFLRISVGNDRENARFLEALDELQRS